MYLRHHVALGVQHSTVVQTGGCAIDLTCKLRSMAGLVLLELRGHLQQNVKYCPIDTVNMTSRSCCILAMCFATASSRRPENGTSRFNSEVTKSMVHVRCE